MKIAVMGAGGVGGYFGGLLARTGHDITFIARGAHLDAIKRDGLRVTSDLSGPFTVRSEATADTTTVGPVDLVMFTVKTYHNPEAIRAIMPMVGLDTAVLTLQNGVDSSGQLAEAVGGEQVLTGVAYIQARIEEPGVVAQLGRFGRVIFGEMKGGSSPRGQKLQEAFVEAGWPVELTDDANAAAWRKFVAQSPNGSVDALSQTTVGDMRTTHESRDLIRSAMAEHIAIAGAKGVDLGDDVLERSLEALDAFPADGRTSIAKDLRGGRPIELEALAGAAVRMGRETGVPTPVTDVLYALLEPAAVRATKSS